MGFDTSNPVIYRAGYSAVTYDMSRPFETTITIPAGSSWSSGLHWHETHIEFLYVVQGSIRVRLGPETLTLFTGQQACVPTFVRHEWSRASVSEGDNVIVIERTEPRDEEKQLFFWNLNGVILTTAGGGVLTEVWLTMRLFLIFQRLDNWPVLLDLSSFRRFTGNMLPSILESIVTHCLLAFTAFTVTILGYQAVDERFVPPELLDSWKRSKRFKLK